jgi:hypothetical protein
MKKEVIIMTSIGWEFYGLKFGMLLTMLISAGLVVSVWLGAHKTTAERGHIDTMAGDEGDD